MLSNYLKDAAMSGNLPKKTFTKERIYYIRDNIDLYYFLSWYDSDLFYQEASQFKLKEKHWIVVSKTKRYCCDFIEHKYYDCFDFCQKFLGLRFYSALFLCNEFMNEKIGYSNESLNSPSIKLDVLEEQISQGKYYKSKSKNQVWGYLCGRGIDRTVVEYFIEHDFLYCVDYGKSVNICFPLADKYYTILGFEIKGTLSSVKFKSNVTTEVDSYFWFDKYYDSENYDTKMFCFESAIDLMSFVSLVESKIIDLNGESVILVSLRGIHRNILQKAKNEFGIRFENVFCFTDSDIPSFNFCADLEKYNENISNPCYYLDSKNCKDWNELLKSGFSNITNINDIINYIPDLPM